ncbi:MAG TPA: LuxR C-terminal-related transcriptional regulator [Candidatus Dormibacteraeota bacterium]
MPDVTSPPLSIAGAASPLSDRLTPQELQMAQMAAAGKSSREIGQSLGITSRNELRDALDVQDLSA